MIRREELKLRDKAKHLFQLVNRQRNLERKSLIFVIGCQRSGTTMLMRTFTLDWRTKTYGETGLSPAGQRDLLPEETIAQIISDHPSAIHVVKPLCDSQNVVRYLDHFPDAKAIWVYRDYRPVSRSNLIKWGFESAKSNLRPMIAGTAGSHWATEKASTEVADVITRCFAEDMLPYDAVACFWWMRNRLFFDLGLHEHPRVMLCQYETLVKNPADVVRYTYDFLEQSFPGSRIIKHIHSGAIKSNPILEISSDIQLLCEDLMSQLDRHYAMQMKSYSSLHESKSVDSI